MMKDELFDNFIFKFNVSFCRNHLNTQNIDFPNGRINFFFFMFQIVKFYKIIKYSKIVNYYIIN